MFKKWDRNMLGLLINNGLHNILTIYMNTFVIAYLLNTNDGKFTSVALYYTVSYLLMLLFYTGFSFLTSKIKKTKMMRLAILFFSGILFYMSFFGSNISNSVIPIAITYTCANALYWSAYNSLANQLVKGKKLKSHNTYLTTTSSIISIVIPVVFGSLIDYTSLMVVSLFVMTVCFIQLASTFFLKEDYLEHHHLDFKGYYNDCYNNTHKSCFKLLFLGYVSYGCKDAASVLITILIVYAFKTNTSLGTISSLISILTITLLLITNHKRFKNVGSIYFSLVVVAIISMIGLLVDINPVTIIIFNICYSTLLAILNRSYAVKRSGIIRAIDKKEYIVEHQAVNEFFLNIGRVIFYSILLFASLFSDVWVYKMLIAVAIVFVFLFGVFAYALEKEYDKILIEKEFKKQLLAKQGYPDYQLIPSLSNPNEINLRHMK